MEDSADQNDINQLPYSVTINDTHQPSLTFVTLNQLRRQQQLCDIELRIGDARFTAHQVVLAASSPLLHKLISAKPSTVSHVTLSDNNLQVFAVDMLLEFMYTSIVKISRTTVQPLCYAAKELMLVRVEKACCKFMTNSISADSGIDYLMQYALFAMKNRYPQLRSKCVKQLTEKLDSLVNSKLFLSLPPDRAFQFSKLFEHSFVVEVLVMWTKHDTTCRQQYLDLFIENLDVSLPNHYNAQQLPVLKPLSHPLKNIFVAGGNVGDSITSDVEMYDHAEQSWRAIPNLPKKRSHCSLVSGGRQLYLIGGFTGTKRTPSVDVYNPDSNEWILGPSLMMARSGCGATVFRGEIYVVGGYDGSKHLSSVEIYDPKGKAWRDGPTLKQARSYVQAVVAGGVLYAVGGADDNGRLSSVEKLMDCKHQWTQAPPLTVARSRPGVAVIKKQLYVCGGYDGHTHLSSVETLEPGGTQWAVIANMSVARNSPGACAIGQDLYVFGGYSGRDILDSMEVYHTDTDSWSVATPMTTPRCDFGYAIYTPIVSTDV